MDTRLVRAICSLLIGVFAILPGMAQAEMVGIGQIVAEHRPSDAHARLDAVLAREEVRRQLGALGISDAVARARAQALTDAEAASLAGRIEQLPAGGVSMAAALAFLIVMELIWYFWVQ